MGSIYIYISNVKFIFFFRTNYSFDKFDFYEKENSHELFFN